MMLCCIIMYSFFGVLYGNTLYDTCCLKMRSRLIGYHGSVVICSGPCFLPVQQDSSDQVWNNSFRKGWSVRSRITMIFNLAMTHVWGCSCYVLEAKLQDKKRLPKWIYCARMGRFLGFLRVHSLLYTDSGTKPSHDVEQTVHDLTWQR